MKQSTNHLNPESTHGSLRDCAYCGIPIRMVKNRYGWYPYELHGGKHTKCVRKNKDGVLPL
jgi:hypothetical protein